MPEAPTDHRTYEEASIQLFGHKNLKTIEASKKVINYFQVTLDPNTGKYYPVTKPGEKGKD